MKDGEKTQSKLTEKIMMALVNFILFTISVFAEIAALDLYYTNNSPLSITLLILVSLAVAAVIFMFISAWEDCFGSEGNSFGCPKDKCVN